MRLYSALCLTLSFCTFFNVYSQNLPIPEIAPKTPQAASLGQFGNVPVNAATGQMSFTVPIHNINVDGQSWPVALQYNYGGLILESKPTLTGLGGTLQGYGTVSKQVRGLPDGHPKGYYGIDNVKNLIDNYVVNENALAMTYGDYMKFADGTYDSEVDKYIVNIGSVNFSFKVRKNGSIYEPYYLSHHNHKVTFNYQTSPNFEILDLTVTDDQGIKYFFSQNNREYPDNLDPQDEYALDSTTSWMLSKITYLNGQEIVFNYSQDDIYVWDFSASAVTQTGTYDTPSQIPNDYTYTQQYGDQMRQRLIKRQRLDSINFPRGSIIFGTETKLNGSNSHLVYNQILVKDHNANIVNDYDLSYIGNRDCLSEVKKNNQLLYGFSYYGETGSSSLLPSFNESVTDKPFDQDFWKFYNGKGNTQAIGIGSSEFVDKSPVLIHTMKGAMKQIRYPTGGYTEINYGLNQLKTPYLESNGNTTTGVYNREIHLVANAAGSTTYETEVKEFTHTFDVPVKAILYHKIIGDLVGANEIDVEITSVADPAYDYSACYSSALITTQYYPMVLDDARLKLLPPNPADPDACPYYPLPMISPQMIVNIDPNNGCPWYGDTSTLGVAMGCSSNEFINQYGESGGEFWIQPGTYTFRIDATAQPGTSLFGEIHLRWWQPEIPDGDPTTIFVNENIGGLRVESIRHFPSQGENITTYYDYNDSDGYSTAFQNQIPFNTTSLTRNIVESDGVTAYTVTSNVHSLNSFGALDAANGVPVYYDQVRTFTKVNNTFNPLSGGNTGSPTLTSSALNNDGTSILNSTSPFEVWPPIVVDGTGTEGTFDVTYPEGYTIYSYEPPAQLVLTNYPRIPQNLDKTGARMISDKKFNNSEIEVSSVENTQQMIRPDLGSGGITAGWDDNNDHPWSFKMKINPVLDLYFNLWDYDATPSTTAEEVQIMNQYFITYYREVEAYHTPSVVVQKIQGVETTTNVLRTSGSKYYVAEQTVTDSQNKTRKTVFEYPFDLSSESTYYSMVGINQLGIPVQTTEFVDGQEISKQKTEYVLNTNGYKPKSIKTSKGGASLESRFTIDSYDGIGNVQQMAKIGDVKTSFIYGYNGNYPVAKIVGASQSEVITALGGTSIPYGTSSFDNATEAQLIAAFNQVRAALPQAQIVSYTYKPLVGVTTITDPRGYTSNYIYDVFNRLERIEDQDGNILEEYEYNFIND